MFGRKRRFPLALTLATQCQSLGSTLAASARTIVSSRVTKPPKLPPPWRILFFGTDDISLKTLQLMHKNKESPVLTGKQRVVKELEVVCMADAVNNVESPVKAYAQNNSIVLHQPQDLKEWQVPLDSKGEKFDIAVVVSFGKFIPKHVIGALPYGGINMHPSLLPRHRGAAPLYHALLNGDTESGVSIVELHKERFDAGRILKQAKFNIDVSTTYNTLKEELATLGAKEVMNTLADYHELVKTAQEQNEEAATAAPKVTSEMGNLDWEHLAAPKLYNQWRAFGDTIGVFTYYGDLRLKIMKVERPGAFDFPMRKGDRIGDIGTAGELRYDKKQNLLWVKCQGGWIACSRMQVDGKRAMDATSFVNGYFTQKADKKFTFTKIEVPGGGAGAEGEVKPAN